MSSKLPFHQEAVRSAVLDGLPAAPRIAQEMNQLRESFLERLKPTIVGLPAESISVSRYSGPKALLCPASSESEFEWKAVLAARSIGLPVLSYIVRNQGAQVRAQVHAQIRQEVQDQRSIGQWLALVNDAGRSAVVAAASTWVARAQVAVPWREFERVRIPPTQAWYRPFGNNTPIVISGRFDASVPVRTAHAEERVMITLGVHDATAEAIDLLAVCHDRRGTCPLRSVTIDPSSGTVQVTEVDGRMLAQAAELVVSVVEALVPKASGQTLARISGPQCWRCDHLAKCHEGSSWARSVPSRQGGIEVKPKV
jgi:hypothetical protein